VNAFCALSVLPRFPDKTYVLSGAVDRPGDLGLAVASLERGDDRGSFLVCGFAAHGGDSAQVGQRGVGVVGHGDQCVTWHGQNSRPTNLTPTRLANRVGTNSKRAELKEPPMSTSAYVQPKDIAAQVRANIKAAQKAGDLDPSLKIRVRTGLASMCSEVNVHIQGEQLTNEYLLRPEEERREHGCWTPEALKLAAQVRGLMAPALEWEDGRMKFACLYFRDGLVAP
jgi:hypothetical protein